MSPIREGIIAFKATPNFLLNIGILLKSSPKSFPKASITCLKISLPAALNVTILSSPGSPANSSNASLRATIDVSESLAAFKFSS